jgi:DNA polymerase-3 subunit gamma/tau
MSENYIVSARKYRPQTFDTVVGQEHITTTLKNAIRHQHLAHAYLFCGPRGVGKTTCARILARTINCENPTPDIEACGVCPTCVSFQNNTSFNIFELDAASNNSVDDIRELVNQVRFAPQQGKYKIYIIDEVHMLSTAAFNAFLKTLEEPPPYAIFILATTEKHKILPTILSRCQIFDFKRITTQDTVTHLQSIAAKEGLQAEEAALHVIAQKSEGCMRDALSMLDRIAGFTNGVLSYAATMEHLNILDADFYFKLTDHMLAQDVSGTLLLLDEVLEKGFEGDVIISGLSGHLRNLLLCKDQRMVKLLDVPKDHKPIYFEKAHQTPPSFILSALHVLNDSELAYETATNKRLHVELCLIRLCYVLQATHAPTVSDEKKNNSPVTLPVQPPMPAPVPVVQVPEQHNPLPAPDPQPDYTPTAPQSTVPPPSPQPQHTVASTANVADTKKRITRSMLNDFDEVLPVAASAIPQRQLTTEWAQELFSVYAEQLQNNQKQVLFSQFSVMHAEAHPPDEIRIISPSEITNEFALAQRNDLMDYFRTHTGRLIRVTTAILKNETPSAEKVLSKLEIFQAMADKNPEINNLKNALNLTVA